MPDDSLEPSKWIRAVDNCFKKKNYNFVVFLLDRNDNNLYSEIKKHSLVSKGYISQFVKIKSLNKNILSVCSSATTNIFIKQYSPQNYRNNRDRECFYQFFIIILHLMHNHPCTTGRGA